MARGVLNLVCVVALLCAACSSASHDAAQSREITDLRGEFGSHTVEAAVDLLAGAGIVVRERPGADPLADVDDPGPLSLLRFQARNLALEVNKGNGTRGANLDAYTKSGGGSPISYLIAGWAAGRVTPSAAVAADLLGLADAGPAPVDPPDLLIPGLVVALFLGDVARVTAAEAPIGENTGGANDSPVPSPATASRVGDNSADFCADVSAYLSASLNDTLAPGRDLNPQWLQAAIDRYSPEETDPQRLRTAIGATALMVYATSIAKPWQAVLVNDLGKVHYRVEGESAFGPETELNLFVEAGEESFATEAAECALLADAGLTEHTVEGARVQWLWDTLAVHVDELEADTELDEFQRASLGWTMRTEPKKSHDEGVVNNSTVRVGVLVERAEIEEVGNIVESLLTGADLGLAAPEVAAAYSRYGRQLDELLQIRVQTDVPISWHGPKPPEREKDQDSVAEQPETHHIPNRAGDPGRPKPSRVPTTCPPAGVVNAGLLEDVITAFSESGVSADLVPMKEIRGGEPGTPEHGGFICAYGLQFPVLGLVESLFVYVWPFETTVTQNGDPPSVRIAATNEEMQCSPPPSLCVDTVDVPGAKQAWFVLGGLVAVVDGWTLSIPVAPNPSGALEQNRVSARSMAIQVINWSRR
jgi:hypothetical protein